MVKQRMTALDVRATVEEMRASLVGLRLLNIYNISNKMFLFKFGHGENKRSVLVENGVRLHLTELAREKPKVPSQFTLKLRKHIRAWRLDSITQLQHDRTVDLCFGVASTEGCFHILIELFSKGNIILTDHTYKMMMLLRTHRDDEGLNLMVNQIYPVTATLAGGSMGGGMAGGPPPSAVKSGAGSDGGGDSATASSVMASNATSRSHLPGAPASASASVVAAGEEAEPKHVMLYPPHVDTEGYLQVQHIPDSALTPAQLLLQRERTRRLKEEWDLALSRSNDKTVVQALVAGIQHFGPDLAQHILTVTQVSNQQRKNWTESPDELFQQLLQGLLEAYDLAKMDLTATGGYLIKQRGKAAATAEATTTSIAAAPAAPVAEQYESFTPILFAQYTKDGVEAVYRPSFGQVCDEFFLITETERIDASNDKRKNVAKNKQDKFAADHARRIGGLETDMAKNQEKGEQLILSAERVDEAIQLINGALATGISWEALRTLLKRRHAEGHPVAYMIHDLFLDRNAISVLLEAPLEDEEDDCDVPPLVVEVALSKTAHANAADYFAKQKQNRTKLERTVASTDRAAAGAARKGARKAAEQKEKKVIVKERQRHWWEKFFWFRTTAGDLVLRGKDVQSTELLLRRVKKLGDVFVQCEVDGSLPCLVRPLTGLWQSLQRTEAASDATPPVATASIYEAAAWCVALSGAWESKQTTGAWWVYASQVTGGSASGMYVFSGERHHLPPQPMPLGCGLLFYVTRAVNEPPAVVTEAGDDEEDGESAAEASGNFVAGKEEAPRTTAELLRQELPRVLSSAQLEAAAASSKPTIPDLDGSAAAAGPVVPADSAERLADMPSVEALRADQRRQQQTYAGPPHPGSSGGNGGGGRGKKGSGAYARNARVDRDALQGKATGGVSVVASPEKEEETASVATATTQQQQHGKTLSKHQKKKLKKIQDKYGDQDEEDRVLGAQVNGNQLSRVQLLELERLAAAKQAEEAEKRQQEKATRQAARAAGTLRYHPVKAGEPAADDDSSATDEKNIEEVSDFTDDDGDADAAAASSSVPLPAASPPPPAGSDDLAEDSEQEEPTATTAAASPTSAHPESDYEDNEKATWRAGAAADADATPSKPSNEHDVLVAQQTAELYRAFPHYTMRPAPTDIVHHVVAVCAPMMTVSEYAYHVTLAMGNSKKGVLAGKLLQVFTERAERGGGAAVAGGAAGASAATAAAVAGGKRAKKGAKAHVDPSKTTASLPQAAAPSAEAGAAVNASVVTALQRTSAQDIVEQLRANVKPVEFRV